MRPGKLMRFQHNATIYPNFMKETSGKRVPAFTKFLVISVKPEKYEKIVNWYDLKSPWLILVEDKLRLVDVRNRSLMDVTPFLDKNGEPYWPDYFLK